MTRLTVALTLTLAHSAALACTSGDYAQFKDRAKEDPMKLARAFCLAKDLWDIRRSSGDIRGAAICSDEMTKTLDALSAVKARAAIRYIEKTCPIGQ